MLRYRIAAMVALFMLLGAAREGRLELGPRYLLAALALASSYVAATALNDLADEAIDQVNHPRDAGRPPRRRNRDAKGATASARRRFDSRLVRGNTARRPRHRARAGFPARQPGVFGPAGAAVLSSGGRAACSRHRVRRRPVLPWDHCRTGKPASRGVRSHVCAVPALRGTYRAQGLPRPGRRRSLRQTDAPPALRQDDYVRREPVCSRRRRRGARGSTRTCALGRSCRLSSSRLPPCCGRSGAPTDRSPSRWPSVSAHGWGTASCCACSAGAAGRQWRTGCADGAVHCLPARRRSSSASCRLPPDLARP